MAGPGRGKSGGTGYPISWRCSKCRREDYWKISRGPRRGHDLHLTGQMKHEPQRKTHPRSSAWRFEYRCRDCGHVGWSRHHQAEAAYVAKFGPGSLPRRLDL